MSKNKTVENVTDEDEDYERILRDQIKVYLSVRIAKHFKREIDRLAFDEEASVQDTVIGLLHLGLRVREATGAASMDDAREALEDLLQK